MNLKLQAGGCDEDSLEALLRGELSAEEERELALHLNDCEHCRRLLAERAADPDAWMEAHRLLQPPPFDLPPAGELAEFTAGGSATRQSPGIRAVLAALAPTDDPQMLGRLGGYEIAGVVGSGGMGVVFKAIDRPLNRTVAIKVLAPHLATSGAARKRFVREAQAAAAVLHPNVVAIHSVSSDDPLPYLVMPYLRGPSLQKRLDEEGPLALQEVLRIGAQVAAGLAAAHAQGLVHRDITPANILLEEGVERVAITDFGLARTIDDATITKSGVIAGTPQYMSPEQARGEAVDPRSDLFSLGSVLYAMCTGRPPFRAETSYGVLRRITDDEPTPPCEINPDIPDWLCRIIARLMAKRPADRFASAAEVAELLEKCLAHIQHPTAVPLPVSLAPAAAKSRFSSRTKLSIGALAMIATLSLGLIGLFLWQSADPPDISGRWSGEGWGQVVLEKKEGDAYVGTYNDTFGKEVGRIELSWSRLERRFKGSWREGTDRFGKIAVRLVDGEIRGAWTASEKSGINPGNPELADLLWKRSSAVPKKETPGIRVKLRLDGQQYSRPTLEENVGFDQLSILGSGVSGTIEGKAYSNLVAVLAHGCRLESFEEMEHQGKKFWSATFFVPQGPTSDGSNLDLSQKLLDQWQAQGVRFWLDHLRDQAPSAAKDWIENVPGKIDDAPAYGEKQGDLQLGLQIKGDQRKFPIGGEVKFEYVIKNVGKKRVQFEYEPLHPSGHAPRIRNERGEHEAITGVVATFARPTYSVTLEPGEVHRIPHSVFLGKGIEGSLVPTWESPAPGRYTLDGGLNLNVRLPESLDKRVATVLSSGTVGFEIINRPAEPEEKVPGIVDSASQGDEPRFSETKEVVLSMGSLKFMLDLDTGKTMDPPQTIRPEQEQMDLQTDQVQPYHYPTKLTGRGLVGLEVNSSDWDASAAEVRRVLAGDAVGPLKEMDLGPEKNPTYFFETQGGASGILQLLEIVDEPKGIRLRYKTVEAAAPKEPDKSRKIEGTVLDVHEQELVEISLGSDDGLRPGITLIVFRDDVSLGKVTVLRVEADKSAARIDSRTGEIRRGDRVTTALSGIQFRPEPTTGPQRLRQFTTGDKVKSIACSPDGKLIAIANGNASFPLRDGWKPTVDLLDAETGKTIVSLPLTTKEEDDILAATERLPHFEVEALAFSPDGNQLAVGTGIGQVKLFATRLVTGYLGRTFDDEPARLAAKETPENWKAMKRAIGSVRSLAFSPDGSLLAVCGESFAEFADVFDGIENLGLPVAGPGRLKVWEVKTGAIKHDLTAHSQAFASAFSPDGTLLASVGRYQDAGGHGNGRLLWDLQTGEKVSTIAIDANGGTHAVAFSPTKKLVAIGSRHFDKENDTSSSAISVAYPLSGITEWQRMIPGYAVPKGFLPDGKTVVILCGGKSVQFVNVETGAVEREIQAADSIQWNDVAVATKGDNLVIGGADKEGKGIVEVHDISGSDPTKQ